MSLYETGAIVVVAICLVAGYIALKVARRHEEGYWGPGKLNVKPKDEDNKDAR